MFRNIFTLHTITLAACSFPRTGRSALQEMATDGAFKRVDSAFRYFFCILRYGYGPLTKFVYFRKKIGVDPEYPAEVSTGTDLLCSDQAKRYRLYVALACPWASRCLAVYYMKGCLPWHIELA